MSRKITVEHAAAKLSEIVRSLAPNDEVVLTQDDHPVAKIVPHHGPRSPRHPGNCKGLLVIHANDERHLDDFKEYMP